MNQADEGSAVAFQQDTNCQMVNCIIYGNESLNGNQIAIHPETSPIITYCMWQDCPNISLNPNCFRTEPDFVAPSGGAGTAYSAMDADWNMLSTSLAINSGDSDFIPSTITDVAGNPRIHDTIIDCGAYEYQLTPTIQCDIEASSTEGNIPFLVQFYGICNAVDASYEWDFNNDGIVDSNEHDPQYTYNEVGQYAVHLHVENASGNHDCTKTDYITTLPLTTLQGTITTNTTLPAEIIQVTGEVEIASGVTLSIQPGTTLQFQDHYDITVFGRMQALGTEADSIYFTVVDPTGFNNMNIDDGGWGGLFFDCSDPTMQPSQFAHCVFTYGKAVGGGEQSKGGVMYNNGTNQVDVSDSRFHTNRAMDSGGAVYANGPMLLTGCILENNQAQSGGAIGTAELVTLNNCILQNNLADEYGGALFTDFLININNSIVQDNTAGISGGGLNSSDSAEIDGVIFAGNSADTEGGGAFFSDDEHVEVTNSIFSNNQVDDSIGHQGSGLMVWWYVDFSITNSLICNNSSDGIVICNTDSHIANCSFVNNEGVGIVQLAPPYDSAVEKSQKAITETDDAKAPCYNCINWGNSEGEDWISASYELYNVDPCFAAPSAGYGIQYDGLAADWRLTEPSMCINYGTADTTGLNLPQFDLDGNPRIFAGAIGRVDIGPYEYQDDPVRPYMYCDKSGLDFGVITLGNPEEDQLITLYNVGTEELIINSITVSEGFKVQILGQEWTTQLADIHILPGQFKFINVRFNPAEIGVYDGVMIIDSNHIEPQYIIPVSGESVVYAIHVGGIYTNSPIWDAPYIIFDSTVTILGDSLTIMPGCHLIMDAVDLRVSTSLIAEGTEADSIYFSASHGHSRGKIQLGAYGEGTSRLKHCVIEKSTFSGLDSGCSSGFTYSIKKSVIQHNQGAGMYLNCGNSIVEDCVIRNNLGGGFVGNGMVNRCIFTENEGNAAIRQAGTITHLDVANSLIYDNESALDIQTCDLWNCTIVDNGSGLFWECVNHSNIMKNCILWGNDANGVQITLDNSSNHQGAIYNSCIQGGFDNLIITGTTNMTYLNNIDADPLFVGTYVADYHLDAGSPGIDEGTNTVEPFVEPGDLEHHQRIWDGDNNGAATIDMGCYEAGAPVGVPHMNIVPAVTSLLGNYPNPFNPSTEIRFQLSDVRQIEHAHIEIFNIKGQKVRKLEMRNEELEMRREGTGVCSLTWDGTDSTNRPVASGLYFYQLKVNSKSVAQRKMMLLK